MAQSPYSRPAIDKTEALEMILRLMGCGVVVGLLIVLPVLQILGLA